MVEKSETCKAHDHAVLVGCLDDLVITDRTARLSNILNAALSCALDVIAEWEEGI